MATYVSRLQTHYKTTVTPSLMKEFALANPMEVPRLQKVVVNMGLGEAIQRTETRYRNSRGKISRARRSRNSARRIRQTGIP